MSRRIQAIALYEAWKKLPNGSLAEMRRTSLPDDLLNIPAFYRLVQPFGWNDELSTRQRLLNWVFILSVGKAITFTEENISLGQALAQGTKNISEMRMFKLLRSDWPNDIVQLRRLIIQSQPRVNWSLLAGQLASWNKNSRCKLLEDFILAQSTQKD